MSQLIYAYFGITLEPEIPSNPLKQGFQIFCPRATLAIIQQFEGRTSYAM